MGRIAFVFSGQGDQRPGMGKEIFESSEAARRIFSIIDQIRPNTSRQCFEGSKQELDLTIHTQPCVFAVNVATAAAITELGIQPDCIAGFSLGEISALYVSHMLSLESAVHLICKRAYFMDEASREHPGGMAAILKLESKKVEEICKEYECVWPVNYNCSGQTVVAGRLDSLSDLISKVKAFGGVAVRLSVSGAFHSPFMSSAAHRLRSYLSTIHFEKPCVPIYSNVTGELYCEDVCELVSRQVESPVLWQRTVENMAQSGVDTFIEMGVGKTLCGLIKRIIPNASIYNVSGKEGLSAVQMALKGI